MKKAIIAFSILALLSAAYLVGSPGFGRERTLTRPEEALSCSIDLKMCRENLLKYLKTRKDKLAETEIAKIISIQRDDECALWAKAEILRRAYKFKESEKLLNELLAECPGYTPGLISLAYIKYHDDKFKEASRLLKEASGGRDLGNENQALIYMLMGSINARKASRGGLFSKAAYGTRIAGYFEKAKRLAPDLSEVRLGLGSFYLLAPKIAGGNIDKAIEELESAVRLAPDFATPCARLAQAYKQKGVLEKYEFYFKKAKELDPENEVLKELESKQ